jgi:flagellar biogenesis protein FliO
MITSFCVATIAYLVKRFRSSRSRAASRDRAVLRTRQPVRPPQR